MPEHRVQFEVPDRKTMHLPYEFLASGGQYSVQYRDGDVYVSGNELGLLYLAEVLVRCAKGGYVDGFHVHLPQDSSHGPPSGDDTRSELVIFGASEEKL